MSASKTATPDASRRIGSDLERVDKHVIQPEEYEEIPELTDGFFDRAELRIGDKLIRPGRPPLADGQRKEAVNIRLSPDVLAAFRKAGRGWQTRIDQALRQWLKEHPESDAA